jgi:hypothetical protein
LPLPAKSDQRFDLALAGDVAHGLALLQAG